MNREAKSIISGPIAGNDLESRPLNVAEAMVTVHERVRSLAERMSEIEKRVDPVMSPRSENATGASVAQMRAATQPAPLVQELLGAADYVGGIICQAEEILARLTL